MQTLALPLGDAANKLQKKVKKIVHAQIVPLEKSIFSRACKQSRWRDCFITC